MPLHGLSAHRQRGEGRGGQGGRRNHGTTIDQARNPGRQAHPPPGRPAPDHRHRRLRRRHQDARHASRRHRPQPARRRQHPCASTLSRARPPGVVAVFTGTDVPPLGPVPSAASLPGLRVPHHHLLAQDRVYYVGPSRGRGRGHRPLPRARRRRPGRSRIRAAARRRRSRKGAGAGRARRASRNGPTTSPSPITRKAATSKRRSARPTWW